MARLFSNFLKGTLGSTVPIGAVTFNSNELADMPEVVAPNTMVVTFDPKGTAGKPESVLVTAHGPGATSADITRGYDDSVAREHLSGVEWAHVTTKEWVQYVTDNPAAQTYGGGGAENVNKFEPKSIQTGLIRASSGKTATMQVGSFAFGAETSGYAKATFGVGPVSIEASGHGAKAFGYAYGGRKTRVSASGIGAQASGYAYGGYLTASGDGSMATGRSIYSTVSAIGRGAHVHGFGRGFVSGAYVATTYIKANAHGAHAFGYARSGAFVNNSTTIEAMAQGSLAFGYVMTQENGGFGRIGADGKGASAGGLVYCYGAGQAGIVAGQRGSFAFGTARLGVGYTALTRVIATEEGATAFGRAVNGGIIGAYGQGSFATGRASYGGVIIANYPGAFAAGWADQAAGQIRANGYGAFAFGRAGAVAITATGNNATQFGPGANAQADSLQVGTTMRFKGTVGAPATGLHNGDMWVDATGHVFVRTNGVSKSLSGLP